MVALVLGIVSILAVYSACSWMVWRNDGGTLRGAHRAGEIHAQAIGEELDRRKVRRGVVELGSHRRHSRCERDANSTTHEIPHEA